MLHVTNGDAAAGAIRAAGVPGSIAPWREILHEGPVPGGLGLEDLCSLRAAFLAARGWLPPERSGEHLRFLAAILEDARRQDEVVLWFEHDLFDQLQLLQLLDWFSRSPVPRLTLVAPAEYLGAAAPERLAALFAGRAPVSDELLEAGRRGWAAFRAPDPGGWEEIARHGLPGLPFAAAAFRRLLEQLPGAADGLSRSQRQVLEALRDGPRTAAELFALHNAREDPVWLGDAPFLDYLEGMAAGPHPLLRLQGAGDPLARLAEATPAGRDVLSGRADAVALRGVDRWLGGIHLRGRGPLWRWDGAAGRALLA